MRPLSTILLLLFSLTVAAQKFSLEKSSVSFFSDETVEDIVAENTKTAAIFNISTGEVVFSIPIKDFEFDKSLMKEHFNEKYMESEKFPKATFQGALSGFQKEIQGPQNSKAKGKLIIHGVPREVEITGTIEFTNTQVLMKSKFNIKLEDYKIKIPQLLWQNITEVVEVTVDFTFKAM